MHRLGSDTPTLTEVRPTVISDSESLLTHRETLMASVDTLSESSDVVEFYITITSYLVWRAVILCSGFWLEHSAARFFAGPGVFSCVLVLCTVLHGHSVLLSTLSGHRILQFG